MVLRVSLNLFYVVSLTFQLKLSLVSCDLTIVDKWTNNVHFQTASDFVRTGCGSFLKSSYLITSDPLDACRVPQSPPSSASGPMPLLLPDNVNGTGLEVVNNHNQEPGWVLLASEQGDCDMRTKFRNAAKAGYSAIIVGTSELHEDIISPGMVCEDDEEFIDGHLINLADLKGMSGKYEYPNPFLVIAPGSSHVPCREEYKRTWLRSRYISLTIRRWKSMKEYVIFLANQAHQLVKLIGDSIRHTIEIPFQKITVKLKNLIIMLGMEEYLESNTSVIRLLSVLIGLTIALALSFLLTISHSAIKFVLKSMKFVLHNFIRANSSYTSYVSVGIRQIILCIDNLDRFLEKIFPTKAENCDKTGMSQNQNGSNSSGTLPEPESNQSNGCRRPSEVAAAYREDPIKYLVFVHRTKLQMGSGEPLTKASVNNAFRLMALKYHPDKNSHLEDEEMKKLTEKFRALTDSRDILLRCCSYNEQHSSNS